MIPKIKQSSQNWYQKLNSYRVPGLKLVSKKNVALLNYLKKGIKKTTVFNFFG